ncbi:MAG: hypothetical protein AAF211_10615 [Myxococcota bacterium]
MRFVLLALVGCGSPKPAPVNPDPPADEAMAEMGAKKMVKHLEKAHLDPIDWKKAFERRSIDPVYVTDAVKQARTKSDVPVLLPNDPELLENLKIYSGDGWYTATLKKGDRQVFVRGTRASHPYEWSDADRQHMGKKEDVRITTTEGIVTASFSLFGAAYNLEIECSGGEEADPCKDDVTARRYVKNLGLAGGR